MADNVVSRLRMHQPPYNGSWVYAVNADVDLTSLGLHVAGGHSMQPQQQQQSHQLHSRAPMPLPLVMTQLQQQQQHRLSSGGAWSAGGSGRDDDEDEGYEEGGPLAGQQGAAAGGPAGAWQMQLQALQQQQQGGGEAEEGLGGRPWDAPGHGGRSPKRGREDSTGSEEHDRGHEQRPGTGKALRQALPPPQQQQPEEPEPKRRRSVLGELAHGDGDAGPAAATARRPGSSVSPPEPGGLGGPHGSSPPTVSGFLGQAQVRSGFQCGSQGFGVRGGGGR